MTKEEIKDTGFRFGYDVHYKGKDGTYIVEPRIETANFEAMKANLNLAGVKYIFQNPFKRRKVQV